MGELEQVSVVYADSDTVYRTQLLRSILAHRELRLAAVTVDGASALDAISRLKPDIALVAADLGDRTGIEIAEAIHETMPALHTRVVLLADPRNVASQRTLRAVGLRGMLDRALALDRVCDLVAGLGAPSMLAARRMVAPGLEPGTPTL